MTGSATGSSMSSVCTSAATVSGTGIGIGVGTAATAGMGTGAAMSTTDSSDDARRSRSGSTMVASSDTLDTVSTRDAGVGAATSGTGMTIGEGGDTGLPEPEPEVGSAGTAGTRTIDDLLSDPSLLFDTDGLGVLDSRRALISVMTSTCPFGRIRPSMLIVSGTGGNASSGEDDFERRRSTCIDGDEGEDGMMLITCSVFSSPSHVGTALRVIEICRRAGRGLLPNTLSDGLEILDV